LDAQPFANPTELAKELREKLAGLELALVCEYLYARFSLLNQSEAENVNGWPTLAKDVTFARHHLMSVAASEMQHLRWANELLWMLYDEKLIPSYEPVLVPARCIPKGKNPKGKTEFRPRALRSLTPDVLGDFIASNIQALH
jgi:hypothetical protein